MPARKPDVPRLWLMTDERMGDGLWPALARLPRGSGVIFRHYGLDRATRAALFAQVARVAARRRLVLVRAGEGRLGACEQGRHGRSARHHPGLKTWPAHNPREIIAGRRAGADLIFISPVFATRSHPGGRVLGPLRAALLARYSAGCAIALGGMDRKKFRRLPGQSFRGWAAIDAWLEHQ